MHKYKIRLQTLIDIKNFAERVSTIQEEVTLENETGHYRLRASSIIGIIAAVQDWNELWVTSKSDDLYETVQQYID